MDARTRLGWVRLYEEVGNAGVVCRRCGISRPTLRKWWRRYQAEGEAGLQDGSRRPHHSPNRGDAVRHPAYPDRPRPGVLRLPGPGAAAGLAHQVPADPPPLATSQRQGRAGPAHRPEGVLGLGRSQGSGLGDQLAEWQTFFNWQRPHSALGGKPPIDRVCELPPKTPLTEQVWYAYDPSHEPIRTQDYHWDTTFARSKR